jgi:hypothetical protein
MTEVYMTTKYFTKVVLIVTISLMILSGCSKNNNSSDTNSDCALSYLPFSIQVNKESNINDEIIRHIFYSKTIVEGKEKNNDSLYLRNRISEIKEFYNLDKIKSDGYELYLVTITGSGFSYYFVSTVDLKSAEEHNNLLNGEIITICIDRPSGWDNTSDLEEVFEIRLKQAENQGWGYLTEDNMIYSEENGDIFSRMNNTMIAISVPKKLNKYEYLRDLAFEVIKNAELVNVEKLIAEKPESFFITEEPPVTDRPAETTNAE